MFLYNITPPYLHDMKLPQRGDLIKFRCHQTDNNTKVL